MDGSKPVSSPTTKCDSLLSSDGDQLSDLTEYWKLAGSLQYLTLACPNLAFAISHVSIYAFSSN